MGIGEASVYMVTYPAPSEDNDSVITAIVCVCCLAFNPIFKTLVTRDFTQ